MRKCLWIMSICNKREAVEVFIRTGMNCQVLSLEAPVVVVWLTQTHTMRHAESWLRAHSENKNNNMFFVRMRSSKWITNVPLWHELLKNEVTFVFCCLSHSYQTLQPALPVQRDTGCGLHAESGPRWHALLIQGPLQCVRAWGVQGEWYCVRVCGWV